MIDNYWQKLKNYRKDEVFLNIMVQFIERFLNLGCSFIGSIFVVRYLSQDDYGIFAYATSYVSLFAFLTTLGLQSIFVREVIKAQIAESELMGSSFVMMFVGSILSLALAVGWAMISHDGKLVIATILIACLTNIVSTMAVVNYYFQAKLKSRYFIYVLMFIDVVDLLAKILLVKLKLQLLNFVLLGLFESIISTVIIFVIYKFYVRKITWKVNFSTVKYLFKQSLPLALSGLMVGLYMRIDRVMIEHYLGMKEVAEYSVGVRLIEVFYMVPMIVSPNILPKVVAKYQLSTYEMEKFLIKIIRYMFIFALIIIISIQICGSWLVTLLYGHKYIFAGSVFKWGIWVLIPSFIGIAGSLWSQTVGLQKYAFWGTSLSLIVCIVLNLWLIPKFGIVGATAGLVASNCIAILSAVFIDKIRVVLKYYFYGIFFIRYPQKTSRSI